MAASIIQKNQNICYICGEAAEWSDRLEEHHVFEGPDRSFSEKYGLKVRIHGFRCHREGKDSIHKNADVANKLKADVQKQAMEHYGWGMDFWLSHVRKNYI